MKYDLHFPVSNLSLGKTFFAIKFISILVVNVHRQF